MILVSLPMRYPEYHFLISNQFKSSPPVCAAVYLFPQGSCHHVILV